MNCERCGHESLHKIHAAGETCIANLRADLARCNADASTIENHMRERLAGLEAELEAERARSWELRVEAYLDALQNTAMRAVLTLHDDWANMPNPQFVEKHGEYITETVLYERTRCALATDAGRHLLTAVRRLCEVAEEVRAKLADGRFFVGSEERDLREALADPALAGLQGTGPKVAHDDSDRKRD